MIKTKEVWSDQATDLVYKRYLPDKNITIDEWISKVVEHITTLYTSEEATLWAKRYHDLLYSRSFLPTSACLHNSLQGKGSLAGCTVLPLPSEVDEIFNHTLSEIQYVLTHGTGVGIDLTVLPPRLLKDNKNNRAYPGPVEVLTSIVSSTDGILLYTGLKRAAFMASLYVNHPDVFEFIKVKSNRYLQNVNISVAVDEIFKGALKEEGLIPIYWVYEGEKCYLNADMLKNMHNIAVQRSVDAPDLQLWDDGRIWSTSMQRIVGCEKDGNLYFNAHQVLRAVAEFAHTCGDPGILNMDSINRDNPTHPRFRKDINDPSASGEIHVTTPCGEQPLLPYEVCHLGSFNLNAFTDGTSFDFEKFKSAIYLAVRFMDDVVEVGDNGLEKSNYMARTNRKIGLGIMGLADVLAKCEVAYDSEEGRNLAESIVETLQTTTILASEELAEERGAFDNFNNSIYAEDNQKPRRHATLTTIAPTGHISMLADSSTSIEPYYLITYLRNAAGNRLQTCEPLREKLEHLGYTLEQWIEDTVKQDPTYTFDGTLQFLSDSPTSNISLNKKLVEMKNIFKTSHEIAPIDHLIMVSNLQRFVENGISKTINLPNKATVDEVFEIMLKALEYNLKGITVYRDGCLQEQALSKIAVELQACPACGEDKYMRPNDCGALSCDSTVGGCGYEGACNL